MICEKLDPYTDKYDELSESAVKWDEGHQTYLDGLEDYNAGEEEYSQNLSEYESGLEKYNASRKELDDGWQQYYEGTEEYNSALKELTDGQETYDAKMQEYQDGVAQLDDGENRYDESYAEYEAGVEELEKAKAAMSEQDECHWLLLDMNGNASYLLFQNHINSIKNLGMTFSLVFIIVGAMVIYSTLGRIVDEQRNLIGATKALGFFNREIFGKYLIYGVSGTLMGMAAGTAVAYFFFQRLITTHFSKFYTFNVDKLDFFPTKTAIVWLAGIAVSSLTVWGACSNLIRSTAISLMQGKVPQKSWKSKQSKKGSASLYRRLVLLNILSDKKRVAVTVISITGCCTLIVAGFTFRYSITKSINYQFGDIQTYDMKIEYNSDTSETAEAEIQSI